jgi:hypothetical protein
MQQLNVTLEKKANRMEKLYHSSQQKLVEAQSRHINSQLDCWNLLKELIEEKNSMLEEIQNLRKDADYL